MPDADDHDAMCCIILFLANSNEENFKNILKENNKENLWSNQNKQRAV